MKFYVINNHRFDDTTFAYGEEPDEVNLGPSLKCDSCKSSLTLKKWLPPYEISVSKKALGDAIFGTFENFIVSKRFRSMFEKVGLKGIHSFHPVAVYFRGQLLDELYYLPRIVMSDAHVDLGKSGFEFEGEKRCPACQKAGSVIRKWNGIIFEKSDMIDLDIFNTKVLPSTLIVSDEFRRFVQEHNFSNISMVEASKYGTAWSTT